MLVAYVGAGINLDPECGEIISYGWPLWPPPIRAETRGPRVRVNVKQQPRIDSHTAERNTPILDTPAGLDHLARLLQNLAPGTGPIGTLERVDGGYSAIILRATSGIAVRVPKTERAGERQLRLVSPLRRLARMLPVPIPMPLWALPMGDPFPFGVAGYTWLDGAPLAPDGDHQYIAVQLGAFLAAMRSIDVSSFRRALPGRDEVDAERERIVAIAAAYLHATEPPAVMDRLAAWWDEYRAARDAARFTPTLVHGDLWYGNLLVNDDGTRLAGVLDWENVAIDDPAQDIATLMHSGEAFTQAVLDACERAGGVLTEALLDRALWHWEVRELTGIALAIEAGDEAETQDAARKLREGPLGRLWHPAE
jgi:aminoglycoside phosphotransferase (APT) family kinase protein